jgi:hypothetical protein
LPVPEISTVLESQTIFLPAGGRLACRRAGDRGAVLTLESEKLASRNRDDVDDDETTDTAPVIECRSAAFDPRRSQLVWDIR